MERSEMQLLEINLRIDRALQKDEERNDAVKIEEPPMIDRMSASGRCHRERWFSFRGFAMDEGKGFSRNPRLLRVFRLGHVIEDEVVGLLELGGYTVKDQQREIGFGQWLGHIDGLIDMGRDGVPDWCLLEVKSANAARFELLRELGSYEVWNEGYAKQIHAYLHHLDGVSDAVVAVYNKDTSDLYFERILFDLDVALELEKASALVTAEGESPPERPAGAETQYGQFCKWCDFNIHCWSGATDIEFDV